MAELAKRMGKMGAALGALLVAVSLPDTASAFCQATTCDSRKEVCPVDANQCKTTGRPLYWPDLCVSFGVQVSGSSLWGISADKTRDAAEKAFQTWLSADCGGGRRPYIGVISRGEVYCDKTEYNHDSVDDDGGRSVNGPNANVVVFRDVTWPHEDDTKALGLTTLTFTPETGEILDADIELNSAATQFTTGDEVVRTDLQAVLTHEVGHFLGLAHSEAPGATMNADYNSGNLDFRSLSQDDVKAICTLYPPKDLDAIANPTMDGAAQPDGAIDCRGEEPRYGFSRYCGEPVLADGCSVGAPSDAAPWSWVSLGLLGWSLRRKRFRRSGGYCLPR